MKRHNFSASRATAILFSIILLFVGGGFTPLPLGILAGLAGMGINASPNLYSG